MRQILHIDMDAFYASVEQRDDPSLLGRPVLVGGRSRRAVVCAASYEARPFGVHSAMPMMEALRRCPNAIVLPPRMRRYAEVSRLLFEIFHEFTPLVEGLSLDEAFLDVTASRSLFGNGTEIARAIKRRIRRNLDLAASAGVADSKFVAKVASDLSKPDGLYVVPSHEVHAFLAPLPIERMWGVGRKAAAKLRSVGVHTFADLTRASPTSLMALMGTWGPHIQQLALGNDDRPVTPRDRGESIGSEQTYEEDLCDRQTIEQTLLEHAERVAQRLVRQGLWGKTITVKLKYADFTLRTRRTTLAEPVCDTASIYEAARALLDGFSSGPRRIRLTGVAVSNLTAMCERSLFPDPRHERGRKLEEVIAQAEERWGIRIQHGTTVYGARAKTTTE